MNFLIHILLLIWMILVLAGMKKGFSIKELFSASLSGVKTTSKVLFVFSLIGPLTALWRACGTIPIIICYATKLIHPSYYVLATFLLNCAVSYLTGTAFGTAATMGTICMAISSALQINPLWTGGAVMSGIYFGDRCSPMSTSALLVSTVTKTDLYDNIKTMFQTAQIPFMISCILYFFIGLCINTSGKLPDTESIFATEFNLNPVCLLPAVLILLLSLIHIPVTKAIPVSILAAFIIGIRIQHLSVHELFSTMFFGYQANSSKLAAMLNGGGFLSMYRLAMNVCIVACCSELLQKLGFLSQIHDLIRKWSKKITPYGAILLSSIITGAITCNQTVTIMLTNQLCNDLEPDEAKLASFLENTAVVIAPMIPWSVACLTPLTSINAPLTCIFTAFYLYLIPICQFLTIKLSFPFNNSYM